MRIRLVAVITLVACNRLPDQVPCRAIVGNPEGPRGADALRRPLELEGLEVVHDGKPMATLTLGSSTVSVEGNFTAPKDDVRGLLGGSWALRRQGACGPEDQALGLPPDMWRNMSEGDLAKRTKSDGALPIYLSMSAAPVPKVVVDWQGATSITLGSRVLAKGKKAWRELPTDACAAAPPIVIDGKQVGVLSTRALIQVVVPDAGACYVWQDVAYGTAQSGRHKLLRGEHVYVIDELPDYLFERAPNEARTTAKGTTRTELVRVPCP